MKARFSTPRLGRCLRQMVGACFGLLNVRRPRIGRPAPDQGRTMVIAGAHGLYFIPQGRPVCENQ